MIPYYSISEKERASTSSSSVLENIKVGFEKRTKRNYAVFIGKDGDSETYILLAPYSGGYSAASSTIYHCELTKAIKLSMKQAGEFSDFVDESVRAWHKPTRQKTIKYSRFSIILEDREKARRHFLFWTQKTNRGTIAVLELRGTVLELQDVKQVENLSMLLKTAISRK